MHANMKCASHKSCKSKLTHQANWTSARTNKLKTGIAKCQRTLCKAGFRVCTCSRQSTERLPLVTVAKAKLTALNTQCTVFGNGMLTPPKRVMYCIQRVTHAQLHPCSRMELVHCVKQGTTLARCALQQSLCASRQKILSKNLYTRS